MYRSRDILWGENYEIEVILPIFFQEFLYQIGVRVRGKGSSDSYENHTEKL